MTEECTLEFDDNGVARLCGPLTFATCAQLFKTIEERKRRGPPTSTLDLEEVTRVDSAGLALLLELQARHVKAGQHLRMRNAPPGLIQLARLGNATELLDLSARGEA